MFDPHRRIFEVPPDRHGLEEAATRVAIDEQVGLLSARAVLAALPVAVYETDAEGRLTFYNEAAAEIWGRRPELGVERWSGAWRLLHADGTPLPHEQCALARTLRAERSLQGNETIVERPDGTRAHVIAFPKPVFDSDGSLIGVVSMLVDISERKAAEEQLRESEAHYRHFMEVNPAIFWTADPAGNVTIASEADARLLGAVTHLGDIGSYDSFVHPDDREATRAIIAKSLASGEPIDSAHRFLMRGRYRWVRTRAHARRGPDGAILRWYGSSEDIHRRKVAEDALRTAQARLTLALDGNKVGVWDWNIATGDIWFSDSAFALQGYGPGEIRSDALAWREVVHPEDLPDLIRLLHDLLRGRIRRLVSEHRIRIKAGTWIWVADRAHVAERDASGRALRIVGTRADISDRKSAEERVRWLAGHDSLTGLPNRRSFQEVLGERLAEAEREKRGVSLLLFDVDGLKEVNDALGHDAGDILLRTFADRLRVAAGGAFLARLGGDEFAAILTCGGEAGCRKAMSDIQARLREPFLHAGRVLDCRASIGTAIYPKHGLEADELFKSADVALYAAKTRGGGSMAVFEPAMRSAVEARTVMIRTAREALDADRVRPFYQPKVTLSTGRLAGFEALLRWRDPKGRFRLPATIGAAFDDFELANGLGERMLQRTMADMRRWLDAGLDFGHVALNVSAAQFHKPGFAELVLTALADAGLSTDRIELEVTETVFLGRGSDSVLGTLKTLSTEGVRIALDDFGTGYASLTHLKQFPVDIIKLDRSFVSDLEDDAYDAAIVRTVLNLGQGLGIDIVAEGVETSAQAAYLWAQGCAYGQGHLFGKPVPAARVPGLIAGWQAERHWGAIGA